jgi:hypothetical protein
MRLTTMQLHETSPSGRLHKLQGSLDMGGGKKETLQMPELYIHEIISPLGLTPSHDSFVTARGNLVQQYV